MAARKVAWCFYVERVTESRWTCTVVETDTEAEHIARTALD